MTNPHTEAMERNVVASMMVSAESALEAVSDLRAADFHSGPTRTVFETVAFMLDRREAVDTSTVARKLAALGKLDDVGGETVLWAMVNENPTPANVGYYVSEVRRDSKRRAAERIGKELVHHAQDAGEDVNALIVDSVNDLLALDATARDDHPLTAGDMMRRTLAQLDVAREAYAQKRVPGISYPEALPTLNHSTAGMMRGELIIVQGFISQGKSTLAHQIALHVAKTHGPVAEFVAEQTAIGQGNKTLASLTGIDSLDIRHGRISEHEYQRIQAAAVAFDSVPLYTVEHSDSFSRIRTTAHQLAMKTSGLSLVVIDYVQLLRYGSGGGRFSSRTDELDAITAETKRLAGALRCAVIVVSQPNSAAYKDGLSVASGRGSVMLGADADALLSVFPWDVNDKDRTPPAMTPGRAGWPVKIQVTKARDGCPGKFQYAWFDAPVSQFVDADEWARRTVSRRYGEAAGGGA